MNFQLYHDFTLTAYEPLKREFTAAEMHLTDEQVMDFQSIYKVRFGTLLSFEEANALGSQLVQVMRAVYRPITNEDYEIYDGKSGSKV